MATRFIRVRGRVVPIKDKTSERKGYGVTAGLAAGSGATVAVGGTAMALGAAVKNQRAVRFGMGAYGVGAGLGLAAGIHGIYRAVKAGRKEKSAGRGFIEYAKHYGASTLGSLAGLGLGAAAIGLKQKHGAARRLAMAAKKAF